MSVSREIKMIKYRNKIILKTKEVSEILGINRHVTRYRAHKGLLNFYRECRRGGMRFLLKDIIGLKENK